MGKIKYISKIRKFLKESPVINTDSLKKLGGKKNKGYIYLLVNNLIKKGEIKKITKGFYTIHDDPSLIVFCLKPSYLGLQDALSMHNLWEQETIPVVVTVKKARQGIRKVFGVNILVRRIDKKYFFGFEYMKYGDFYVPVSNVEKTFIDLLYFKHKLDDSVLNNFKKRVNKKQLESYLKRYPKRFKAIVLKKLGK